MVMLGAGDAATRSTNHYGHLVEAVLFVLKQKGMLTEGNTCCKDR